ncbi:hypothetical protein MGYG_09059 [Nannizzia gypsea CBS 118893]|uniref:Uncharacterized protein n=1 Tax=Arthroderma gypseum (strain ATCC MYA-4604 / CBS 118893) TaxID=535722 RepID=E4UWI6_ARTGP|nr:hypothetical protein MGYG_09059 [Nannizzia gypsea CBS 118893]EFR01742.1 hypothetical protein MGYG_09059 [Nannizzia gypsea CBS 118893]
MVTGMDRRLSGRRIECRVLIGGSYKLKKSINVMVAENSRNARREEKEKKKKGRRRRRRRRGGGGEKKRWRRRRTRGFAPGKRARSRCLLACPFGKGEGASMSDILCPMTFAAAAATTAEAAGREPCGRDIPR